jgi:hypothetical protein
MKGAYRDYAIGFALLAVPEHFRYVERRKRTKRLPVKLTLCPLVRAEAELLPEVVDRGLSALVERLLRLEIARVKAS